MKIVVLSIVIILTFLGNVAVIAAISARSAKMTRMYYFILHLSLADLLTAFLTLVPEVAWTFTMPNFHGGAALCKLVKFTQMLGPYLSSYVLIMTAVDRYQAICNPLGNCTWTPRRSQVKSRAWITETGQHYPPCWLGRLLRNINSQTHKIRPLGKVARFVE